MTPAVGPVPHVALPRACAGGSGRWSRAELVDGKLNQWRPQPRSPIVRRLTASVLESCSSVGVLLAERTGGRAAFTGTHRDDLDLG